MIYYKRFPGDYQRDTGHLSLAEHGAYTMLLDHYYATSRPLPAELDSLYRLCRAMTTEEQTAVRSVVDQFFPLSEADGSRHNKRADEELADRHSYVEQQTERSRRGVAARRRKATTRSTEGSTLPDPYPSSISEPHKEKNQSAGQAPLWSLHESLPAKEWQEWLAYCRERRRPIGPTTLRKQLALLKRYPTDTQREMIDTSIRSGWPGIYAPKESPKQERASNGLKWHPGQLPVINAGQ